jgi:hypothetical protein
VAQRSLMSGFTMYAQVRETSCAGARASNHAALACSLKGQIQDFEGADAGFRKTGPELLIDKTISSRVRSEVVTVRKM